MVPQQKYDVIHYVREAFLKPLESQPVHRAVDDNLPGSIAAGSGRGPEPESLEPWVSMDYGPHLTASYEVGRDGSNFAYKGIAIRLDPGPGGVSRGKHWMLFDHDTMRWAAAWSGQGFIDYQRDHVQRPPCGSPQAGRAIQVANPTGPGWAHPQTGDFDDVRLRGRDDRPYGPLPRDWAHYRGMYHFGNQVILSYTVGQTAVLEMPGVDARTAPSRCSPARLDIGPRQQDLVLQVAHVENASLQDHRTTETAVRFGRPRTRTSRPAEVRFDGATCLQIDEADAFDLTHRDYTVFARINTRRGGSIFSKTKPEGELGSGRQDAVRARRPAGLRHRLGGRRHLAPRGGRRPLARCGDDLPARRRSGAAVHRWPTGRRRTLETQTGRAGPRRADRLHRAQFPLPQSFFEGQIDDVAFFDRCSGGTSRSPSCRTGRSCNRARSARWRPQRPEARRPRRDRARPRRRASCAALPRRTRRGRARRDTGRRSRAPSGPPMRIGEPAAAHPCGQRYAEIHHRHGPSRRRPAGAESLLRRVTAGDESWDLPLLTKGGPPRWPDRLTVQGVLGNDPGPFARRCAAAPRAESLVVPHAADRLRLLSGRAARRGLHVGRRCLDRRRHRSAGARKSRAGPAWRRSRSPGSGSPAGCFSRWG
jgi:hypothetical protein